MKRTSVFALSLLCVAAMSCASSNTPDNQVVLGNAMESPSEPKLIAEEDLRKNKPGAPQATQPEEMHGHSFNATGVSTMEPGNRASTTMVATTSATNSTANLDATLVPNPTSVDSTATITMNEPVVTATTTTTTTNQSMSSSSSIDDDATSTTETRRRLRKD